MPLTTLLPWVLLLLLLLLLLGLAHPKQALACHTRTTRTAT
jgi:hypothetical protein